MIVEALIAAQLVSLNSEARKQTTLQNKWSNNAFETLLMISAVNTFVWPFKFGAYLCRHKWYWGTLYFVMLSVFLIVIPVIVFMFCFAISIIMFLANQGRIEKVEGKKPTAQKPRKVVTKTIHEVDADTGEIIRTITRTTSV